MENLKLQELTVEEIQSIDGGIGIIIGIAAVYVGLLLICYEIGRD